MEGNHAESMVQVEIKGTQGPMFSFIQMCLSISHGIAGQALGRRDREIAPLLVECTMFTPLKEDATF